MKFWDASAIVPLLMAETSSRRLLALAAKEAAILVWWGADVSGNYFAAMSRSIHTGTWSDGFSQARTWRSMPAPLSLSAAAGDSSR